MCVISKLLEKDLLTDFLSQNSQSLLYVFQMKVSKLSSKAQTDHKVDFHIKIKANDSLQG